MEKRSSIAASVIAVFIFLTAIRIGRAGMVIEPVTGSASVENFCTNGGFEDGAEGGIAKYWEYFGKTVELSEDAHSGKYSILLKAESVSPVGLNRSWKLKKDVGTMLPISMGKITFWYKILSSETKGDNIRFYIIAMPEDVTEECGRKSFSFPAEQVGDSKWHQGQFTFDFSSNLRAKYVHVAPRINEGGQAGAGEILIDDIVVSKVGPVIQVVSCGISKTLISVGEEADFFCKLKNSGDLPTASARAELGVPEGFKVAGDAVQTAAAVEPGKEKEFKWKITAVKKGILECRANFKIKGFPQFSQSDLVVVGNKPAVSQSPVKESGCRKDGDNVILENKNLRITFIKDDMGYGIAGIDVNNGKTWTRAGMIPYMAKLLFLDNKNQEKSDFIFADSFASSNKGGSALVEFKKVYRDTDGVEWNFRFEFELALDAKQIKFKSQAISLAPRQLLCFQSATFLGGEGSFGGSKDEGWLPGLEYLAKDEQSSNTLDGFPPHNDRYVPHPNKITIPFMAVVKDKCLIGLQWNALQKWDGKNDRPSAIFASPNFLKGQDNHLMALFVPSIPGWVKENEEKAFKPYEMEQGKAVAVEGYIVADAPAELYQSLFHWFDVFGIPGLPEKPRTYEEGIRLCVDGPESHWDSGKKGWYSTTAWSRGTGILPELCNYMWLESMRTKDATKRDFYRNRVSEVAGRIGVSSVNTMFYIGGFKKNFVRWISESQVKTETQKTDGSWPFSPGPDKAHLGEKGKGVSGTTAQPAMNLLKNARITGDPVCLESGLKALKFLETVDRIPRGGQTWEVPLHTPDVIVAGQAVLAFLDAYLITGDKHYIDEARYWAYTGLPFFYMWKAPDQPIMDFASIPVLGCSEFVYPWFGTPVQWCGIAYIYPIQKLAEYDNALPWAKLAEGMVISSMQQQLDWDLRFYPDKKDTPKEKLYWSYGAEPERRIGMYPDNYSLYQKDVCWGYMIDPNGHYSLTRCIYKLIGIEPEPQTTIIRKNSNRVHFTSIATVKSVKIEGSILSAEIKFYPGEASYGVIAGISKPISFNVNGRELKEVDLLEDSPEGWLCSPRSRGSKEGFVIWKIKHTGSDILKLTGIEVLPIAKAEIVSITAWEFNSKDDCEGWVNAHGLGDFKVSGGTLKSKTTNNDPYMISEPLKVDTAKYKYVQVRMKVSSEEKAQIFWTTSKSPNFTEDKSIFFPIKGDGEFHTYNVRMEGHNLWSDTLIRLRLDPVSSGSGVNVEIDYIKLVEKPD